MRIILLLGSLIVGMTALPALAAEVFVFTPTPADFNDLDHYKWYTWGFDVTVLDGRIIQEVELRIEDISNWDNGENILYIHLLDDAEMGVQQGTDNQNPSDYFEEAGPLIEAWVDINGAGTSENLSFLFSDRGLIGVTQDFVLDHVLGIGLDPDCHYFNSGVSLIVTASGETAAEETSWSGIKKSF